MLMSQTVYGQAIFTLTFMMIGIELRREQRNDHMDDIFNSYSKSTVILSISHIVAITVATIIMVLLIATGIVIILVLNGAHVYWIWQTVMHTVLLFFFPCVILGVWGLILSHCCAGKNVYLYSILTWILSSSLVIYFTKGITYDNSGLRLFLNVINMGMNNYQMFQNSMTGAPIELPRWIVRIGIGCLLAALYVAMYSQSSAGNVHNEYKAKRTTWIIGISGILMMLFFSYQYGVFFVQFADDSYTMDVVYDKGNEYKAGENTSLTNYPTDKNIALHSATIDIACTTNGIEVVVEYNATMDNDADMQSFTLFSNFDVDEVYLNGSKAYFKRNHDGLLVIFPHTITSGESVSFKFVYHGWSLPCFPVNETTVQLNRAFPWLPWPGLKTISANEIDNYYLSENFFVADWQRGDLVTYTMKYKGPDHLYTNLEIVDENTYVGTSDSGVCLYSGMIHTFYRGVDAYVPASLYQYSTICVDTILDSYDMLQHFCNIMDTPKKPTLPESIVVIQMKYPKWGIVNYSSNELFSWGNEWEIRMNNEVSIPMVYRSRFSSSEKWSESSNLVNTIAIPYLLNPCVGYPLNAYDLSTDCFADWLAMIFLFNSWDEENQQGYGNKFKNVYYDINDSESMEEIDLILEGIQNGINFDKPLHDIYQRLLQSEDISPDEMLSELLAYLGVQ